MTPKECQARERFRCVHNHNGLVHPRCFDRQNKKNEDIIGFADIEASNLNANWGVVYTYAIKPLNKPAIARTISLQDLHKGLFDKPLITQFIEDCGAYTRLIWHYGTDRRFDVPFLRTRAVKWGLPFPQHKMLYVSDTYPILKNKFKLHSNRLETACDFFNIPSKAHKLRSDIWLDMITGNTKRMTRAIQYIKKHNIEDVESLEKLWLKIYKYTKLANTSI